MFLNCSDWMCHCIGLNLCNGSWIHTTLLTRHSLTYIPSQSQYYEFQPTHLSCIYYTTLSFQYFLTTTATKKQDFFFVFIITGCNYKFTSWTTNQFSNIHRNLSRMWPTVSITNSYNSIVHSTLYGLKMLLQHVLSKLHYPII